MTLSFQPFLSDLVEAVELVEIDGVAIGHNQAVKCNGHAPLLAEARRSNLLGFAQNHRSLGDDDVLMIMRIQGIRDKDFDWPYGVSVQAIHQNGVENRAFVDEIRLTDGRINVRFQRPLIASGCLLLFFFGSWGQRDSVFACRSVWSYWTGIV